MVSAEGGHLCGSIPNSRAEGVYNEFDHVKDIYLYAVSV